MKTSQKGIDLIKQFEGCKLTAYQCSAKVWTIGYGHTGPDVFPGKVITQAQANELLEKDLEKFEMAVDRLVRVDLKQPQFDALVSFAFNLGEGALAKSTLLRNVNAGSFIEAAGQFEKWVFAGGKKLNGLVRRREAEADMFRDFLTE